MYLTDAFNHGPCMTVVKQLLCFKSKCAFWKNTPSKPGRCSIELRIKSNSMIKKYTYMQNKIKKFIGKSIKEKTFS